MFRTRGNMQAEITHFSPQTALFMWKNHWFNDHIVMLTSALANIKLSKLLDICKSLQHREWLYESTVPVHSVFLTYLTTAVLIRPVPTVIAEVTHLAALHTHTVVAPEHILWTQGLRLWDGNRKIFHECKSAIKKGPAETNMVECAGRAGSVPGRVQLVKSMSSMAMCPGLVKALEASNRMAKSWGIRLTVTSPWCHKSPWLPDSHHSVVVLESSFSTTFSSSMSVTMYRVKDCMQKHTCWLTYEESKQASTYPLQTCCSRSVVCR